MTGKDDKIDLTNIKITATSQDNTYHTLTGFDWAFEFYIPNGTYILTVDENVLTDRFKLLQNNIPVTWTRTWKTFMSPSLLLRRGER